MKDASTKLALAIAIVAWSSAFAGIRASLESFTPSDIAAARVLIGSLVLVPFAIQSPLPAARSWPRLAAVGIVGLLLYAFLLNTGEQEVSAGTASFLVATSPLITAGLAGIMLRERVRLPLVLGILVAIGGVAVSAGQEGVAGATWRGALIILAASLCHSLHFLLQKPLLRDHHPLVVTIGSTAAACLVSVPLWPGLWQSAGTASVPATLALLYLGVVPTAIGNVAWSYVLSKGDVSRAHVQLYVVPFLASLAGWLWLSEPFTWRSALGGTLILLGVMISQRKTRTSSKEIPAPPPSEIASPK